ARDYCPSSSYQPWVRVKEAATLPKLRGVGGMFTPDTGTGPIAARIVEVPENPERTELRDPISGFIAYAPAGTLAKGAALAKGSKTTACAACHGADLHGIGPVPPIAGRTSSYLTRQLWDFKAGARNGPWAPLMKQV